MKLDPELQMFEHFSLPDMADVPGLRAWEQGLAANAPPPDPTLLREIAISDHQVSGNDGFAIPIRVYRPRSVGVAPVLLYLHGGSFVMGNLETEHQTCIHYALQSRAVVVAAHYRLAPEHRFPLGVEDCYTALDWVARNAAKLEIDANRIAVGGSSAGGCLAAAVAIMARDRRGPQLVLQMLVYPTLDDRLQTASVNTSGRTYVFTRAVLGQMWRHYLGGAGVATSPYAAPARITDCSNLPAAYIEACELDPLRDEAIQFVSRLLSADVSMEFHLMPGAPHGFDIVATAAVTRQAFANRIAALRRAFGT